MKTEDINLIFQLAILVFGPEAEGWSLDDIRGAIECPQNEPLHLHHDGCPSCNLEVT